MRMMASLSISSKNPRSYCLQKIIADFCGPQDDQSNIFYHQFIINFLIIIQKLKVKILIRKLEVIKGLLEMTDNLPLKRFVDAPDWSIKDRGSFGDFLQFFALSLL